MRLCSTLWEESYQTDLITKGWKGRRGTTLKPKILVKDLKDSRFWHRK